MHSPAWTLSVYYRDPRRTSGWTKRRRGASGISELGRRRREREKSHPEISAECQGRAWSVRKEFPGATHERRHSNYATGRNAASGVRGDGIGEKGSMREIGARVRPSFLRHAFGRGKLLCLPRRSAVHLGTSADRPAATRTSTSIYPPPPSNLSPERSFVASRMRGGRANIEGERPHAKRTSFGRARAFKCVWRCDATCCRRMERLRCTARQNSGSI